MHKNFDNLEDNILLNKKLETVKDDETTENKGWTMAAKLRAGAIALPVVAAAQYASDGNFLPFVVSGAGGIGSVLAAVFVGAMLPHRIIGAAFHFPNELCTNPSAFKNLKNLGNSFKDLEDKLSGKGTKYESPYQYLQPVRIFACLPALLVGQAYFGHSDGCKKNRPSWRKN